jgi:biotin carboxyl carrier protein
LFVAPRPADAAPLRQVPGHTPQPVVVAQPTVPTLVGPRPGVGATRRQGALSPDVFAVIRRIALQRDLANAAGVLHAELGALLRAGVVLAQVTPTGAISSPLPDDLRAAVKGGVPLAAIAESVKRGMRYLVDRVVVIPTLDGAALVIWRHAGAPVFEPAIVELAAQAASHLDVLGHFFADAAAKRAQAAADRDSMFRAEALAASRDDRRDGELVHLAPRIVRVAVPAIVALAAILIALAAIVQVPSYSRGTAVVKLDGHHVIANLGGRIAKVFVQPGQRVAAGDPLVALDATGERQALDHADTVYRDQLSTFLFDTTDESARRSLAAILAQRQAAHDAVAARTVVAPVAGTVSTVLASDLVQAGEHVATIRPDGAAASVLAFMPGADRSRLEPGMTIQIGLTGYDGARLSLPIREVGAEIMGPGTARKFLGEKLADAVPLPPTVVLVEAALPSDTFESGGKTFSYFDGMDGVAEIEIDSRSFLSVVLPTGE